MEANHHPGPENRLVWQSPMVFLLLIILLTACAPNIPPETTPETTLRATFPTETIPPETIPPETIPWQEPEDECLVRIPDYLPGIFQELPYAGTENFTGQTIYDFPDAYLRYGTIKKLRRVREALREQGYDILIWDGFRPTAAQWKLWEICPDPTYVSDPTRGYSSHSRGNTVDLTLVLADGTNVEMPTGFDDFSHYADRNYGDCPPAAAENARFLEETMKSFGFTGYFGEWWHFTDTDSYDVAEDFTPLAPEARVLTEETALLSRPDMESPVLAWLQPGETILPRAQQGPYLQAEARGGWGYLPQK